MGVTALIPLTPGGFPPLQGLRGLCLGQTRGCGQEYLPGTQGEVRKEEKALLPLGLKTQLGVFCGCLPHSNLSVYPWAHQVTFSEESLPKGHGDFILGYYSHTHSILIGVTEPF